MAHREVVSKTVKKGRFTVGVVMTEPGEDGTGMGYLPLMHGKQGRTADDLMAVGLLRSLDKRYPNKGVLVLPKEDLDNFPVDDTYD